MTLFLMGTVCVRFPWASTLMPVAPAPAPELGTPVTPTVLLKIVPDHVPPVVPFVGLALKTLRPMPCESRNELHEMSYVTAPIPAKIAPPPPAEMFGWLLLTALPRKTTSILVLRVALVKMTLPRALLRMLLVKVVFMTVPLVRDSM